MKKFLDWSELTAFADDKLNVAKMMISLCDKSRKIVEKRENAYQHFFLLTQFFQKAFFTGSLKVEIVW